MDKFLILKNILGFLELYLKGGLQILLVNIPGDEYYYS